MSSGELHDVTRRALDAAVAQLRAKKLSRPAQALAPWVMKVLRRRDYDGVLTGIDRLRKDLDQIDEVLRDVQEQVSRAESASAVLRPFGDAWCTRLQRQINDAQDDELIRIWVGAWVDALAADRLELCSRISGWVGDRPELAGGMTAVTEALVSGELTTALPELDRLLTLTDGHLVPDSVARLLVLHTRLLLRTRGDVVSATASADAADVAAESGPKDVRALALTVRAQVHLAELNPDLASVWKLIDQALRLEPAVADPFVLAGILAEFEGSWTVADEYYEEAFRRERETVTTERLLRPVPANLHWLVARELRDSDPERALPAIESALKIEVTGEGEFVTCAALLDKAAILENLDRSRDAAKTYADAGNRYIWSDAVARGAEVLARACALAPDVAEFRWHYAEALRTLALDADWVVDPDIMERAKDQLDAGLDLAEPDANHAWVLITAAMIADSTNDPTIDPVVLVERALLLDGQYTAGYGFLAMLLSARGFADAAYEAAERAHQLEPFDLFTTRQLVGALANLGRHAEGLEVIDSYLDSDPEDVDALCDRCWMLLRIGDPKGAELTLRAAEPTDRSASMLALCHTALGNEERALNEYRAIWDGQLTGVGRQGLAWSAYRIGLLDESIATMTDMTARMPVNASFACDLGQMLLVRGDLARGEDVLREGIAKTNLADYLEHLVRLEFPVARSAVVGRHHRAEVERILDDLAQAAERRRAELRDLVRPPGPAATAAAGRVALRGLEAQAALAAYRELADAGDIPEAGHGLAAAVRLAFAQGDESAGYGELPAAKQLWNLIRPVLNRLPDGDAVRTELAARLALADVVSADLDQASRSVETLLRLPDAERALVDALEVFAGDAGAVWRQHDRLLALADSRQGRGVLTRVAGRIPFGSAYRLGRELVPDEVIFPVVTALEVRLGAGHRHLRGPSAMSPGVAELRARLTEEMGIEIPGIRITSPDDVRPDSVDFLVHEQLAESVSISTGSASDASRLVLTVLERVVRENLFRMFTVDDIGLWLHEWGAPDGDDESLDDAARVRLSRVLRMLLREGVPIRDRAAVLDGFHSAEGPPGLLNSVRSVRLRLGPDVLRRPADAPVHPIPDQLQDRLLVGLDPTEGVAWEADRSETVDLLGALRSWLAGLPAGPRVLSVRDFGVRPFAWRLLSSERPPVTVLAEEELR